MIDDPTTDGARADRATKPSSSTRPAPPGDTHVPRPKDAGRTPPTGAKRVTRDDGETDAGD